jgi:hypothetical protein
MWLFEPYLQDLYERRQWNEITAFESTSTGARLIAALVLATARTGELVSNTEQAQLVRFHAERRKWLVSYMFGRSCDSECRGKLVDVMLSTYGEAQGDYDEALRKLVQLGRAESGPAMARLHARVLWCQVDGDDLKEFRDRVLAPALTAALGTKDADRAMLEDLIALVAMVPEPGPDTPAAAQASWKALTAAIDKADDKLGRVFTTRRATARRERMNPPPMIKKVDFCTAAQTDAQLNGTVEP